MTRPTSPAKFFIKRPKRWEAWSRQSGMTSAGRCLMNNRAALERFAPLLCWTAAVLVALFICLKILSYGFIPAGDARRHAAKPFADKPYSQIVVMRPEYVRGSQPRLGMVARRTAPATADAMRMRWSAFRSQACSWLSCFPLFWMRHPEAWLAAVLARTGRHSRIDDPLDPGPPLLAYRGHTDRLALFMVEGDRAQSTLVEGGGHLLWIRAFSLDAWDMVSLGLGAGGLSAGATMACRHLVDGLLGGRDHRWRACSPASRGSFSKRRLYVALCIYPGTFA